MMRQLQRIAWTFDGYVPGGSENGRLHEDEYMDLENHYHFLSSREHFPNLESLKLQYVRPGTFTQDYDFRERGDVGSSPHSRVGRGPLPIPEEERLWWRDYIAKWNADGIAILDCEENIIDVR